MVTRPHLVNLLNALVLIGTGLFFYLTSPEANPSLTALIPAFVGAAFLLGTWGFVKQNKIVIHLIVVLVLLYALSSLGMGIPKLMKAGLTQGQERAAQAQLVTGISSFITTVFFVLNFIHNRKLRKQQQAAG